MNLRTILSNRYVLTVVALAVIAAAAWVLVSHSGAPVGATLTVHPETFVQDISVSGSVQAQQNVDLGFAQSGRVSAVYAAVGDEVAAGTPLAQIDNGDLRAAVAQQEAALQAAQAELASLKAGTRPEQIAVTQSQITSDQTALAQAAQSVADAIQSAYTESDDAVHNKLDQFFTNPRTSNPQLSFSTSNSQLATTLVNDRTAIEPVLVAWQGDASALSASAPDLSSAEAESQKNLAQVSALLSDANAALNAAVATTQVPQATIGGYITSVATARGNVNAAQSALTAAITGLQSAQASLDRDQKDLVLEQAGSTADDIAAQAAQVAVAEANVESAQAQLQKTIVAAPFDGTVTRMDAKVGEVVSPSDPQISMISNGLFQIQCYVPEVEIAQVAVGDLASSTLDAYGPETYFAAKVIAIDPAETSVNGVSTYKTTLQFLNADPRIKSGMTADVDITTESIPRTFAVPQGAVFQKGGQQVVQVLRAGHPVDVPVETGGNSAVGNIEITSGLFDGDTVVLNPDTTK